MQESTGLLQCCPPSRLPSCFHGMPRPGSFSRSCFLIPSSLALHALPPACTHLPFLLFTNVLNLSTRCIQFLSLLLPQFLLLAWTFITLAPAMTYDLGPFPVSYLCICLFLLINENAELSSSMINTCLFFSLPRGYFHV
jgi:hypothetical protein